ncbi:CPBP family intramembrane glutamic endopeptidase [Beijerinckia indica]|uniref:Abortive infection protein n=1 Tax=Beijerinckia indica subsp. indica (strain ATCC 9039 / DSM 1715 / NCIMB 8712) TaxID=395963 RepID=B2IH06_BEII9|nr:CPBP family intramembrane glutamic endopeptidase [Beijerinckia indica]ACB94420.1 Abortive infection protein [Beijerinckia indica subsp. indica ATCC 9039]
MSLASSDQMPGKAKPYEFFGLCVSLLVIAGLTLLFCLICTGLVIGLGQIFSPAAHIANLLRGLFEANRKQALSQAALRDLGLATSFLFYAAATAAILVVARWRGGRAFRDVIGWRPWNPFRADKIFWLIAGATLAYSFAADFALTHFYPQSENWFNIPKDLGIAGLVLLLTVVFAPICEELFFRGWIYTSLRAQFGLILALLVSSGIFAFLHYEKTHLYALIIFPIGLALGVIRERNGLAASTGFHALFNFAACAVSFIGND